MLPAPTWDITPSQINHMKLGIHTTEHLTIPCSWELSYLCMSSTCCSTLVLAVSKRETTKIKSSLVHQLKADKPRVVDDDMCLMDRMASFNQLERFAKSSNSVHTTSPLLLLT